MEVEAWVEVFEEARVEESEVAERVAAIASTILIQPDTKVQVEFPPHWA